MPNLRKGIRRAKTQTFRRSGRRMVRIGSDDLGKSKSDHPDLNKDSDGGLFSSSSISLSTSSKNLKNPTVKMDVNDISSDHESPSGDLKHVNSNMNSMLDLASRNERAGGIKGIKLVDMSAIFEQRNKLKKSTENLASGSQKSQSSSLIPSSSMSSNLSRSASEDLKIVRSDLQVKNLNVSTRSSLASLSDKTPLSENIVKSTLNSGRRAPRTSMESTGGGKKESGSGKSDDDADAELMKSESTIRKEKTVAKIKMLPGAQPIMMMIPAVKASNVKPEKEKPKIEPKPKIQPDVQKNEDKKVSVVKTVKSVVSTIKEKSKIEHKPETQQNPQKSKDKKISVAKSVVSTITAKVNSRISFKKSGRKIELGNTAACAKDQKIKSTTTNTGNQKDEILTTEAKVLKPSEIAQKAKLSAEEKKQDSKTQKFAGKAKVDSEKSEPKILKPSEILAQQKNSQNFAKSNLVTLKPNLQNKTQPKNLGLAKTKPPKSDSKIESKIVKPSEIVQKQNNTTSGQKLDTKITKTVIDITGNQRKGITTKIPPQTVVNFTKNLSALGLGSLKDFISSCLFVHTLFLKI